MPENLAFHSSCAALLKSGASVLLGLSGGRDSVALLLRLLEEGVRVHARHFHHGLRGAEADADAAFCRDLCAKLGVDFAQTQSNVAAYAQEKSLSFETAARELRRAYLQKEARACGTSLIVLGQHADDQAETALFRLARGAAGLRAMRPVHHAEGFIWLRPLIACRRAAITQYLHEKQQNWRDDQSNEETHYTRNALRHKVLPALQEALGRDVIPILARSSLLHTQQADALEEALAALPLCDPQGRLYLPALVGKSTAFISAVLHRYLRLAGVPDVGQAEVEKALLLLEPETALARINLPANWQLCRRHKRLVIQHTMTGEERAVTWA